METEVQWDPVQQKNDVNEEHGFLVTSPAKKK